MKISMGSKTPDKRTCVVCGKVFYAKGNRKTCGHLCSDSPKTLQRKNRKKLENVLDRIRD